MSSEVDICNLALSHLGANATLASIKPPEGSAYAEYCATYYPLARDTLLEMHAWGFATIQKPLAKRLKSEHGYSNCFMVPDDCLRIVKVLNNGCLVDYERRVLSNNEPVILTDSEDVQAVYIKNVTDTTRFSPLFITALSWQLASMLAGVVIKGTEGAKVAASCTQYVTGFLNQARFSDSSQHKTKADHVAPWIRGR